MIFSANGRTRDLNSTIAGVIARLNVRNGGKNESAWIGVFALAYQYSEQAALATWIIYSHLSVV